MLLQWRGQQYAPLFHPRMQHPCFIYCYKNQYIWPESGRQKFQRFYAILRNEAINKAKFVIINNSPRKLQSDNLLGKRIIHELTFIYFSGNVWTFVFRDLFLGFIFSLILVFYCRFFKLFFPDVFFFVKVNNLIFNNLQKSYINLLLFFLR